MTADGRSGGAGARHTTNNRMELRAVLELLRSIMELRAVLELLRSIPES